MKIASFYSQIKAGTREKGLTIDEAMQIAKENGIKAVDLTEGDIYNRPVDGVSDLEDLMVLLKKYDMYVSSVFWAEPCIMGTEEAYNKSLDIMKKGVDFAKKAESKYFMAVPERPMDSPESEDEMYRNGYRRLLAELSRYGKEVGVQVTVEDYSLTHYPYATFEDIDWLLQNIPELKFTYDSGNFPLTGIDELESAKRYADYTVHVHLKDLLVSEEPRPVFRNGKYYDCVELGGGYLKNEEALLYLKEKGYDGALIIEVSDPDTFDRTIKSAQYLRRILNA